MSTSTVKHTSARLFAEKLNAKLDELDMPSDYHSRIKLLAKLLHIPPDRIRLLLKGLSMPNHHEMDLLIHEVGFDPHTIHGIHSNKLH
jgi:hypothetical protein